MQIFKKVPNFDFMGKRKLFLAVSGTLVLLSIVTAIYPGPKWGIDFAAAQNPSRF